MDELEYWKAEYRKAYAQSKYWQEAYFKVKDENERLALDLGIKDSAQSPHLIFKKE